jgi:hypothetical protein
MWSRTRIYLLSTFTKHGTGSPSQINYKDLKKVKSIQIGMEETNSSVAET